MRTEESRQIEILRVFCITAMMWVHVSPGISTPSIVSTGEFALVGAVFGNTLGRVSVVLLSFISGYLLWQNARQFRFGALAMRRFRNVLIPMLVWSALYILLAAAKEPLTGVAANRLEGIDADPESLANAWAGITGPTANPALFFLRDLFVSTLILRAARPLVERAPVLVAAVILAAAPNDALAPVVFRPSILQFLFFGAIVARLGYTITTLSRPLVALPLGYLISVAGLAAAAEPGNPALQFLDVPILLRRVGVGFLFLALAASVLALMPGTPLCRLGRHAYLAFLMHVPVIGILWVFWQRLVGGADAPAYLIFYLAAPLAAFALAGLLGLVLDRSPPALQLALRGKTTRPGGPQGSG